MDGCNPGQMIFRVLMPILKPVAVTNIVVTAIGCWNDFMIPLFYLGSSENGRFRWRFIISLVYMQETGIMCLQY